MESHCGEVQELPRPSPPPPQNMGDEPLTTEETKKGYHKGCPGCQLEKANERRTGIPYLSFFYICIISITSTLPITSLFPYQYFMIRDMNIAKREEDISFYAGFVGYIITSGSFCSWTSYWRVSCTACRKVSTCFFFQRMHIWEVSILPPMLNHIDTSNRIMHRVHLASSIAVLVYQFAVYPSIVKYFGPIRPLRPAVILSILLLTTYRYMYKLHGLELKALINVASIFKNVFSATVTTACNILQNTTVTHKQRGAANGISVTLLSLFQGAAPAGAGILFSWSQKHVTGLFLPGGQILFLVISMVAVIGLILTFRPFFSMSNALSRS